MKKTRLKRILKFFSVDFNPIDTNNILDIHKYLMKGTRYKIIFGLIKKIFIGLLTGIVSASNHIKDVLLSNQKCMIQPTLINLHPNEYSQEFHYYPFTVKLDKCVGSCNSLNDFSNKVCVPNKTEDLNLSMFDMITGINQSKTLTKHISCQCNVDLMEKSIIQINGRIMIKVDVNVKDAVYVKKIMFEILHIVVKIENI